MNTPSANAATWRTHTSASTPLLQRSLGRRPAVWLQLWPLNRTDILAPEGVRPTGAIVWPQCSTSALVLRVRTPAGAHTQVDTGILFGSRKAAPILKFFPRVVLRGKENKWECPRVICESWDLHLDLTAPLQRESEGNVMKIGGVKWSVCGGRLRNRGYEWRKNYQDFLYLNKRSSTFIKNIHFQNPT